MMPAGGNDARSKALSELAVLCHETLTAPEMAEWIEQAEAHKAHLNGDQLVSLREIRRIWLQATVLPSEFVEAKSIAGSKCEYEWRTQRRKNDKDGFIKNLREVVLLSQKEAKMRAEATGLSPYDAMLDLYEPGMTTSKLDQIFGELRSWLPQLTQQIIEKQQNEKIEKPEGPFDIKQQSELGKKLMGILGFDFNHGRLDVSIHPFCGGVPEDVRITTRYDEEDFTSSVMGVIHETGHARYEQGLPKKLAGLPSGQSRSMAIHESQSLFFEMQLARSPGFVKHLASLAKTFFNRSDDTAFEYSNMIGLYKRVQPGYIRVDADEVTYPAHVMLRYDIERALIEGLMNVEDIPEMWNEKMQAYLGLSTEENYSDGFMQDIHWTSGSFGYFPSYTLGAMYAAQFMTAMCKTLDVQTCISTLNFAPVSAWLEENIWSKGSTLSTAELLTQATGEPLDPEFFRLHLIQRYLND